MPCDLSVVLPVYDEARVLEATFAELVPRLEALGKSFEIVCVDDGSSDDSWAILERLAAADERVRIDRLPRNQGKGAAVRKGMMAAEGELQLFMDADLSTPLDEMAGFLGALESGYDVVIGNRRGPGARITRHQPWIRETLGRGFTVVTRVLLAPGVHDFTCGFKAFRREAAREIFARSSLNGWAFDAELVVIAHARGLRLAQVPVAWHDEDGTKVRVLQAVLGSLRELGVIGWKRLKGDYR